MKLADIRKEYTLKELDIAKAEKDPFKQFDLWMQEAVKAEVPEPTAMTVATASKSGRPSSRIILLKGVENGQFVFYTNYNSCKGQHLAENPFASLTFFWPELERQVRIEGAVARVDAATSDTYFHSRPRGSQIGAHVSPQSQPIPDRGFLEQRGLELQEKFGEEGTVPRPGHWGGYAVSPENIEFWQGRASRLHDRLLYTLQPGGGWHISRLAP